MEDKEAKGELKDANFEDLIVGSAPPNFLYPGNTNLYMPRHAAKRNYDWLGYGWTVLIVSGLLGVTAWGLLK